ncbi:isocitrate lyase/PEP mutase family protein [Actinoallomurus iriomotensis]|uniref:Carboxyvinyl-carboxyphosphonate phosphorylmutase n=1 Tax=Actinoallomurus iriomotensis TaxID=478107 RepID=A0A9W6S6E3_9ACTN|nr:isocitrate lyase/phosphoenolpyruvate mutase family protein [Actinoallomurus iriomotensis]GLY86215.1 carboxyvinyl-carboxyphosphonate phosphorylmutase [Actinoallomurus iriomotensis]
MSLIDKAARLRELHQSGSLLILPNAWDAASAQVLAAAGFPALATASAAVSRVLGYEDGEGAPPEEMFAAAARIARSVDVPVTVDAESGYGLTPAELAECLREAGAAGCNLEDTLHGEAAGEAAGEERRTAGHVLADLKAQADRIRELRAADPHLVINARTDVFEDGALPGASPAEILEEAVARGRAYLDAGADCVFPIMVTDEAAIGALVERLSGPVSVLYRPGMPSPARLAELGVARVTFGPGLHRATMAVLGDLAGRLRDGAAPY